MSSPAAPARPALAAVVVASLLTALGCEGAAHREPVPGAAAEALVTRLPTLRPGEVLLDARADGAALVGLPHPAPADSDAVLVLTLRVVGLEASDLEGREVLDARFVGEAGLLVLERDHTLLARPRVDGVERVLDRDVEAPLSVSGDWAAYARGEAPELEIVRARPLEGSLERVHGATFAWSPAVSADGEVVYVTSATGRPTLAREGGPGVAVARFPTGPGAPRLVAGELVFEDAEGVVRMDARTLQVREAHPGLRRLARGPLGELVAQDGAGSLVRLGAGS